MAAAISASASKYDRTGDSSNNGCWLSAHQHNENMSQSGDRNEERRKICNLAYESRRIGASAALAVAAGRGGWRRQSGSGKHRSAAANKSLAAQSVALSKAMASRRWT